MQGAIAGKEVDVVIHEGAQVAPPSNATIVRYSLFGTKWRTIIATICILHLASTPILEHLNIRYPGDRTWLTLSLPVFIYLLLSGWAKFKK